MSGSNSVTLTVAKGRSVQIPGVAGSPPTIALPGQQIVVSLNDGASLLDTGFATGTLGGQAPAPPPIASGAVTLTVGPGHSIYVPGLPGVHGGNPPNQAMPGMQVVVSGTDAWTLLHAGYAVNPIGTPVQPPNM